MLLQGQAVLGDVAVPLEATTVVVLEASGGAQEGVLVAEAPGGSLVVAAQAAPFLAVQVTEARSAEEAVLAPPTLMPTAPARILAVRAALLAVLGPLAARLATHTPPPTYIADVSILLTITVDGATTASTGRIPLGTTTRRSIQPSTTILPTWAPMATIIPVGSTGSIFSSV